MSKRNKYGLYDTAGDPKRIKLKRVTATIDKTLIDCVAQCKEILERTAKELRDLYGEHIGVGDTETDSLITEELGEQIREEFYEELHH
jgi:hypothetical protein